MELLPEPKWSSCSGVQRSCGVTSWIGWCMSSCAGRRDWRGSTLRSRSTLIRVVSLLHLVLPPRPLQSHSRQPRMPPLPGPKGVAFLILVVL
ncbi:unnamed protein product [Prunus armeniaca]